MLDAALVYAELGLRVVLAYGVRGGRCDCGDPGCGKSAGKHPIYKGWRELASSDPEVLRAQFAEHPRANIGIATGRASGIVAIDIDGDIGRATWDALEREHGITRPTWTVVTSRGHHLLFRVTADMPAIPCRVGASERGLGPGVDVRGEGGQFIAPPSVHASGHVYDWMAMRGLGNVPDALDLMQWVIARVVDAPRPERGIAEPITASASRRERYARVVLDRECSIVRTTPEGARNDALNLAAWNVGLLVYGGQLDQSEARYALTSAALDCGLGEREIAKTIVSAFAGASKAEVRTGPERDLPREVSQVQAVASAVATAPAPEPERIAQVVPIDSKRGVAESRMVPVYSTAQLFERLPPQRWAVSGLHIGPGRPTLFAGYGGSAKTMALQSLALACASGRAVWGKFETAPISVLHIDYEQTMYATAKRYQRLARGYGIDLAELGSRLSYIELPRAYLDDRDATDQFMRACDGFDLVIIDPLRGAAPRSDENDSSFRVVLDVCTYVSQRVGPAVIVIHHAGKPKEGHAQDGRTLARGSSAIFDACGCVFNIVSRPDARLVQQVKAPAEAQGGALDPFELVISDVAIDGDSQAGVRMDWRVPALPPSLREQGEEAYAADVAAMLDAVRHNQGCTSNKIVARSGVTRPRALVTLKTLAEEGQLIAVPGPNRSVRYSTPDHRGES